MENGKTNEQAAPGAKCETRIVPDKETRVRLCEENDAQVREIISKAEALFALTDEMVRQTFEDLERSRPQMEMANDPKLLLPYLQFVKASGDALDETLNLSRRLLQSDTDLAEKISLLAATEIDPDTKRHFMEMSDRLKAKVALSTDKLQEGEIRKQLRSKELSTILADINDLIATPVAKPLNEKD